ncbi:CgeB family protein [Vibrio maritimus]|uniref:CgeB family protein n=1 Tax=Vibrio maritimus TaxID=990268 RepID=UPI001F28544E|nr:glycosyltransferase [Vibrio maritimus]
MKIVYVDYQYHYGKPELGNNDIGLNGFIHSFETLGHQVVPFFYDELTDNVERLNSDIITFCREQQPDLVFFLLSHDLFKVETIQKLTNEFTTINFFGDDHWRFEAFTKKLAPSFTYCVTTDHLALDKYHAIGVKNVILSQWAALEPQENNELVDGSGYKYDVTFVGGKNPYRNWFIKYLEKKGVKVDCFGVGWPNGPVSLEEMQSIFSSSKINLNISNSISYDIRFLMADPIGFARQLRSTKSASQIKARNYEIPAFNGFQLTDYVPFIEESYHIGHDLICYSNIEEAIDMVVYYLKNDDLREQIKSRAVENARNNHFYIHRIEKILSSLNL